MFRKYAETIGWTEEASSSFSVEQTASESVKMLSEIAKEHSIWLIGGKAPRIRSDRDREADPLARATGSIPELSDEKVYNSAPVFSPDGKLVALHRKVHLFDIDMSPTGGIVFKESDALTGGDRLTMIETGCVQFSLDSSRLAAGQN
jgi:predicted amidohydrolase